MNVYTVKGVSYSEVEANSKEEAIEEYKENILEYICDNWEVMIVNDDEKVTENLKFALSLVREELKEAHYEDSQSPLNFREKYFLFQVESNLEKILEELGVTGYKRTALKRKRNKNQYEQIKI